MKWNHFLKPAAAAMLAVLLLTGCGCKHERWNDANCTTPKTCADCGITEGEPMGHDWQDADCDHPKTCKYCGETEGDPLEHQWKDADCTHPKTCELCGKKDGNANGHKYSEPDCENPKICSVCNDRSGSPLGHDAAVTCEEDGICNRCGKTVKATGHNWRAATCTEPKTCKNCGATEGEAKGHSLDGQKCKVCGEEIEINLLLHSNADFDIYYQGCTMKRNRPVLLLKFVNKSNVQYNFQNRNVSLNGVMIDFLLHIEVMAGTTGYDDLKPTSLDDEKLIELGLDKGGTLETVQVQFFVWPGENLGTVNLGTTLPVVKIDVKNNCLL